MPTVAAHGSWRSPIAAEELAAYSLIFTHIATVGDDLYWVEARITEGGRHVLMRRDATGATSEVTPDPYDVRSRVHEYGGRAVAIDGDGTVYFVHFADQQLYVMRAGDAEASRLTPEDERRYLHPVIDRRRRRVIAVCEDHRQGGEPVNCLVAVPMAGGEPVLLARGRDFYYAPALSPDGDRLAYTAWDHPNMPWDTTVMRIAELAPDGSVARDRWVAGGHDESVGGAAWAPDGSLYLLSDRSDAWSLYRHREEGLARVGAGPGELNPLLATLAIVDAGTAFAVLVDRGIRRLVRIDLASGRQSEIATGLTEMEAIAPLGDRVAVIGGSPTLPISVVTVASADGRLEVVRPALELEIPAALLPAPEAIEFPTRDGGTAHAFYYRPSNPEFVAPAGDRPPLLVLAHSGPIAATTTALRCGFYAPLAAPFWTSRGYAVVDVDYRGSTGYGRAYRRALYGRWGEVDVDDVIDAARFLIGRGEVDPARVAIGGGSAGGFTALAALAFRDFFAAGVSYFGVSDLETFTESTHKYEKHFTSHLVAPWPERRDLYRARSPLHAADRIASPLLVAQGLDDHVVLPEQATRIVAALRARQVPVAYLEFAGEGHGFVRSETLVRCLESALAFVGRVFRVEPADRLPPLELAGPG